MKPIVTINLNSGKKIKAELYEDIAPQSVRNFVDLVKKGFYDGLKFHRVIPGFMIQGGCPEGIGTGGPGYSIKGEFRSNGVENDLKHSKGILSMARSQMKDSAGSQFFIMVENSPHLDGDYAAFGKVIEGVENAVDISKVARGRNDMPIEDQIIKSITVENAENIEEPIKL